MKKDRRRSEKKEGKAGWRSKRARFRREESIGEQDGEAGGEA